MTLALTPSTATKATLLDMAFEELASAGYEFDNGPEERISALRKLDAMMAAPPFGNLALGYNAPIILGEGDPLDALGCPDSIVQILAIALGVRHAPSWGKSMSAETRAAYRRGINDLLRDATTIPVAAIRAGTPVGSGNRWRSIWAPFVLPGETEEVI